MPFMEILLKAPFDSSPAVSTNPEGCSLVFLLPPLLPRCIATSNFMVQSLFGKLSSLLVVALVFLSFFLLKVCDKTVATKINFDLVIGRWDGTDIRDWERNSSQASWAQLQLICWGNTKKPCWELYKSETAEKKGNPVAWARGWGCLAEGTTRSMCLLQIGLLCHILQCAAVIASWMSPHAPYADVYFRYAALREQRELRQCFLERMLLASGFMISAGCPKLQVKRVRNDR